VMYLPDSLPPPSLGIGLTRRGGLVVFSAQNCPHLPGTRKARWVATLSELTQLVVERLDPGKVRGREGERGRGREGGRVAHLSCVRLTDVQHGDNLDVGAYVKIKVGRGGGRDRGRGGGRDRGRGGRRGMEGGGA
jgi:hypothetical protein